MANDEPIEILVTRQHDGTTYQLRPRSRERIEVRYPEVHCTRSIFVGYDTESDFKHYHGPLWKQIVLILTGLTAERLAELGGYKIYDSTTEETFFDSRAA